MWKPSNQEEFEQTVEKMLIEFPELEQEKKRIFHYYSLQYTPFTDILEPLLTQLKLFDDEKRQTRLQFFWDKIEQLSDKKDEEKSEYMNGIVTKLLDIFPEIEENLREMDPDLDLPYIDYESLIPWTRKWIDTNNTEKLKQLGEHLEEMISDEEKDPRNIIEVSFLEPMVLADSDLILPLYPYLGKNTRVSLKWWMKRFKSPIILDDEDDNKEEEDV